MKYSEYLLFILYTNVRACLLMHCCLLAGKTPRDMKTFDDLSDVSKEFLILLRPIELFVKLQAIMP